MTISTAQLDEACNRVVRNYPPENSVEAYDYCCEELERLVESCIQQGIRLNHPAVLNYKEAKQAKKERMEEFKRLKRNVCVETVADLRALLSELPPDMPLIYTSNDFGNLQGLFCRTGQWAFTDRINRKVDTKWAMRITEDSLLLDYLD